MDPALALYPDRPTDRNGWILERRGRRFPVNAEQPYAFLSEQERFADGTVGDVATVFLTNRECPWRCLMCDLWQHTLTDPVQPGQIPRQIAYALERLPPARQIKLYNSGSFFDRGAIPPGDYAAIAALLQPFERVVVECHPALIGEACFRFAELIQGQLEVAMGLETAHPDVLEKLNKRMTLQQYAASASELEKSGIALRAFVLLQPPFMEQQEALLWAQRSIAFAQECGATVVSLIPTRSGNGAVDELASVGLFDSSSLSLMEEALAFGIGQGNGRVFLDLWDFDRFAPCPSCRGQRKERLQRMNMSQELQPKVVCMACGSLS